MEDSTLVNKVAASGLITIDPATYIDSQIVVFDLKDNLFQGLILREKDFREFIKAHDWQQYQDKVVSVICSADAIIPTWALMLLGAGFEPYTKKVVFGDSSVLYREMILANFTREGSDRFIGKRVVIKGCGDKRVPESIYLDLSVLLKPVVKSLMFGEPCSTVPIFKNP